MRLRGRARVVLEPLGLSRSSRQDRLESSSLMTPLDSARHSRAVCVASLLTLNIQESVQVRLVEGGAELRPFGDGDGVLGATLAVPVLG